jgi:hypothetical protein
MSKPQERYSATTYGAPASGKERITIRGATMKEGSKARVGGEMGKEGKGTTNLWTTSRTHAEGISLEVERLERAETSSKLMRDDPKGRGRCTVALSRARIVV